MWAGALEATTPQCYETVMILVSNPLSEIVCALTQKIWKRSRSLLSPVPRGQLAGKLNYPATVENMFQLCQDVEI